MTLMTNTGNDNATDDRIPLKFSKKPNVLANTLVGTPLKLNNSADEGTFVASTAQYVYVPTGLRTSFGCSFKGTVTFQGGATLNDVRVTGSASPWCALIQTGLDTYDIVGGAT